MSTTLNAVATLAATLVAFGLLALLVQAIRNRRFGALLGGKPGAPRRRLGVEEICPIDPKRRLLLVRCDERSVLLLTGGPTDVVLSVMPFTGEPA